MNPIVIAGNGPSVRNINYKRLPKVFDSYRVNQFYFEDKYYLGKDVTYAGFITHRIFYVAYMYYLLEKHGLYRLHTPITFASDNEERNDLKRDYPHITFHNLEYLNQSVFGKYLSEKRNFFGTFPNFGTVALMEAIKMGYKEIYLVGIDFYNPNVKEADYTYDQKNHPVLQEILEKTQMAWLEHLVKEGVPLHSPEMEKETIQLCASLEGIKIYSIVDECSLNDFLPLAPEKETHFHGIEDKPFIAEVQDWSLSPHHSYLERQKQKQEQHEKKQGRIQALKGAFYRRGMQAEWRALRENIYLRLVLQAFKIPWIFLKFLKRSLKK